MPILHMKKLRLREIKKSKIPGQWEDWDLTPGWLTIPSPPFSTTDGKKLTHSLLHQQSHWSQV